MPGKGKDSAWGELSVVIFQFQRPLKVNPTIRRKTIKIKRHGGQSDADDH